MGLPVMEWSWPIAWGRPLVQIDTFQYHPSGGIYPEQLVGALVTEGIRSEGGHLVKRQGVNDSSMN